VDVTTQDAEVVFAGQAFRAKIPTPPITMNGADISQIAPTACARVIASRTKLRTAATFDTIAKYHTNR